MAWKTQLVAYFNGNEKVSKIVNQIESVGFESSLGPVDFQYIWDQEPTKEQVLELADKLSEALKDMGVIFNIDTHN
jgi:coenzyme F420-reducing hydrogenase delta subunit